MATQRGRSDFPRSSFGVRLRALREAAGLSQEALARAAVCSSQTVSNLERGGQEPYWPLVLALARALGATPDAFLGPRDLSHAGAPGVNPDGPAVGPRKKGGET